MKRSHLALAIFALLSAPALGQDLTGTYSYQTGGSDPTAGAASIDAVQGTFTLRLIPSGGGAESLPGHRIADGRLLFVAPGPAERGGLLGAVEAADPIPTEATHVEGARTILLERTPHGLRGTIQDGAREVARISLERERVTQRALLVWSWPYSEDDQKAFRTYARQLDAYYRGVGYRGNVVHKGEVYMPVIELLEEAGRSGQPFCRLVIIGHGGWDGPVIGHTSSRYEDRQISGKQDPETFQRFADAIRAGMTPGGKIFSSSCHAGGSNKYERADESEPSYNWVHDLALRTGRTVAGPAGYTSTEYTFRHVLGTLEGTGSTRQEVHVASPEGLRIIYPGRTLAGARLTAIPPIAQLPKPGRVTTDLIPDPDNEGEFLERAARVSRVEAPLGAEPEGEQEE